ncbi:META domain-containing protein [Roseicyclus persicicus]|uniref:META domain-containing protein n=1 Tax=Roseicyclus persicicus TaxID=2650661 RepID=A0A7X6GXX3_9RHOB|nr:META domain-containing protein [Roseibacterium persicicum]NKX43538.1 META domain-containing protein [Roseibacterium persicicum]
MSRLFTLLAALVLATAAAAQETRSLTGTVLYRDRMALPQEALLIVEVIDAAGALRAEARLPTEGRQVPIPFRLDLAADVEGTLRAGLSIGAEVVWLGDPVALGPDTPADLGELVLHRHQPTGFASAFLCGDRRVMVGFAGEALVMDTGRGDRLVLQSFPAASGARYELPGDPGTSFWTRGEGALVSLGGTNLPDCRLSFPMTDTTAYRAGGNEPFWSVTVEAATLTLVRLGMADVVLPVSATGLGDTGDIMVMAGDATLRRQPVLCRDSMTGMPHPETVTLTLGAETLAGCGGDPAALLIGPTWVVEDIAGAGIVDDSRVSLGFFGDGRVAGSAGCNRWFADVALTGEGLTLGQAGATMMACADALMAQEMRFLEALAQVTGFDIDATGALVLRGPEGALVTARAATDSSAP